MIRTILVPLDGSRLAEHAVPEARRLAHQTGAALVLVRATQPGGIMPDALAAQMAAIEEADEYLRRQAESLRADGITVRMEVLCNAAADAIVIAAIVHGADLIVMSTHGRSGLNRAVFGSVAERVLHEAPAPVLLIRVCHLLARPQEGPYRNILVPLDGTSLAADALRYITRQPFAHGAEISLLRAIEPAMPAAPAAFIALTPSVGQALEQETESDSRQARRYLEMMAQEHLDSKERWHLYVTIGDPAQSILHIAAEQGADLIVMATHDRRGLDRLLQGSVATRVLHQADVPLLLLHGSDRATASATARVDALAGR